MIEIFEEKRYEIPATVSKQGQTYADWCDEYFCMKDQLYAQMLGWA